MYNPVECIKPDVLKMQVARGGDILIIDVRSRKEFDDHHIPCALHIPLERIDSEIKRLHAHYELVTVCTHGGGRSLEAALRLKEMGRNVRWLCGGVQGYFH